MFIKNNLLRHPDKNSIPGRKRRQRQAGLPIVSFLLDFFVEILVQIVVEVFIEVGRAPRGTGRPALS